MRRLPAWLAATSLLCNACSGGSSTPSTTAVKVTATDSTCVVDRAEAPSGEISFDVTNRGSIITEVYLYAPNDRPMGEIENVEPGASESFRVKAGGGSYEVACKPGQLGDGIRTPFRITGTPDPSQTEAPDDATARGVAAFSFEVELGSDRFAAELEELTVVAGQTITFRVHNEASDERGFQVLGTDGATSLGESSPIAPGASSEVTVTFTSVGTYTAIDPIGDHRVQGAQRTFSVIT